jgi:hypothetical protein
MVAVENQAKGVDQGSVEIEENGAKRWHRLKLPR